MGAKRAGLNFPSFRLSGPSKDTVSFVSDLTYFFDTAALMYGWHGVIKRLKKRLGVRLLAES